MDRGGQGNQGIGGGGGGGGGIGEGGGERGGSTVQPAPMDGAWLEDIRCSEEGLHLEESSLWLPCFTSTRSMGFKERRGFMIVSLLNRQDHTFYFTHKSAIALHQRAMVAETGIEKRNADY